MNGWSIFRLVVFGLILLGLIGAAAGGGDSPNGHYDDCE